MASAADTLQRVFDNYARILLLCTEYVANPTQASLDLLLSTAEGAGVVTPKPTYGVDGENYDWAGYQKALADLMFRTREMIIVLQGKFEVRSRSGF